MRIPGPAIKFTMNIGPVGPATSAGKMDLWVWRLRLFPLQPLDVMME